MLMIDEYSPLEKASVMATFKGSDGRLLGYDTVEF